LSEYLTLYPGRYLTEELAAMERVRSQIREDLKRRDMPFEALKASSDGRSRGIAFRVAADPAEVQTRMKTLDPWNPIWFDEDYAQAAGLERLPCLETWPCPKGGYFGGMDKSFGDVTVVKEHHHECIFHAPIYQGDVLYPVLVEQDFRDATPEEGSTWRTWALRGKAKVYNQDGVLVMTQTCGVEECFQIFADPAKRTWNAENAGINEPEFQNHAIHTYTDADWALIRSLWAQEHCRGGEPLYWEDVEAGSQPPVTVDGPYTCPGKGGMIMSVSAPSRSSWYLREHWGEADLRLSRDEFGIYHVDELDQAEAAERREAMEAQMKAHPHPGPKPGEGPKGPPPKPRFGSPVEVRGKATMDNFTGRDSVLRCIHNWIGDRGRIAALSWCIGATGGTRPGIPKYPGRISPFDAVPGMEGRHTEIHGEEGDLSINRLYVTGKRVDEAGRHLVDLSWWCETIEHQIHTEGTATVELPSRT